MNVQPNDPSRAGQRASQRLIFGEFHRFAVFAIHTRFDAVEWFVTDAEKTDPVTEGPAVIRQEATMAEAVAGLDIPEETMTWLMEVAS